MPAILRVRNYLNSRHQNPDGGTKKGNGGDTIQQYADLRLILSVTGKPDYLFNQQSALTVTDENNFSASDVILQK